MSLKVHFASLSIGASVDQQTGSLSVFEIIEEIRITQLPTHLQALVISLSLEKSEPFEFTGKLLIHIFTPDGKQQVVGSGEMKIPAEQRRMKAVFRFGGFPVLSYGQHRFVLSCLNQGGTKIAEALLDFDAIESVQQGQPATENNGSKMTH